MNSSLTGGILATTTALAWGGQFVVGKSALGEVDAFHLTTVRYALAAGILLAVLVGVEGWRSLRLQGRGLSLWWLGTLGFAGFNLLAYTGLQRAEPKSASLIVALGPLLTALVLWATTGRRPSRLTVASLGVALFGVALVITGGHPSRLCTARSASGSCSCSAACSASCSTPSAPRATPISRPCATRR